MKETDSSVLMNRLGNQAVGIAHNFEKVFPVNDKLFYGLPGLATDVYTL